MEMVDMSTAGQIIGGKKVWPKKPKLGGPPQHCDVCNLTLSSTVVAEQHFQGKNHMKNLKKQNISPTLENTPGFAIKQEDGNPAVAATPKSPKVKNVQSCEICELTFTSDIHAKSHFDGQKHAKKLLANDKDRELTAEEQTIVETLECQTCGVTLTSKSHAKTHVIGVKHTLKLNQSRKRAAGESVDQLMTGETNGKAQGQTWACAICELTFNSEIHSKSHFDGARHAKRILALRKKQNQEGIKKLPGAQFFCSFCEENLASKEIYEAHILGETHKANLAKKKEETAKMFAENKKPLGNFECVDCKIIFKEENLLISHYDTDKHKGVIAARNLAAEKALQAPAAAKAGAAVPKPILKNSAAATPATAGKPAAKAPATRGYNKGKTWVAGGTINK